jgi:hypothetical protein
MTNLKYASSSTQPSRVLRGGETYHFAPLALLAKGRSTRGLMCPESPFYRPQQLRSSRAYDV